MAPPDPLLAKKPASSLVVRTLRDLFAKVPGSDETTSGDPRARSQRLARAAARKAGAISAAMSLPPGPLGLVTVLPDLVAIWKVQRQLVADIAAVHGQAASLTRESMLYCVFKHGSAALLRDVVVRAGERWVIRRASLEVLERMFARIGVHLTRQAIGRAVSRYVPVLGALGVGAYAWYDTSRVAANAIDLFSEDVAVAP